MDTLPSEIKLLILESTATFNLRSLLSLSSVHSTFRHLYTHPPTQLHLLRTFAYEFIPEPLRELCLLTALMPSREIITEPEDRLERERIAREGRVRDEGIREIVYEKIKQVGSRVEIPVEERLDCPISTLEAMLRTHSRTLAIWHTLHEHERRQPPLPYYAHHSPLDYSLTPPSEVLIHALLHLYSNLLVLPGPSLTSAPIHTELHSVARQHRFLAHASDPNSTASPAERFIYYRRLIFEALDVLSGVLTFIPNLPDRSLNPVTNQLDPFRKDDLFKQRFIEMILKKGLARNIGRAVTLGRKVDVSRAVNVLAMWGHLVTPDLVARVCRASGREEALEILCETVAEGQSYRLVWPEYVVRSVEGRDMI